MTIKIPDGLLAPEHPRFRTAHDEIQFLLYDEDNGESAWLPLWIIDNHDLESAAAIAECAWRDIIDSLPVHKNSTVANQYRLWDTLRLEVQAALYGKKVAE
jgi:hypothetical protein